MTNTRGALSLPICPVYKVAAIQFEPTFGDKPRNLQCLEELVREAARNDARLIVLPELAAAGYCWLDRDEVAEVVEPIPGPTTDIFSRIAEEYGCYIAVGLPEVDPESGVYYDSLVFLGPGGVIGTYRKTHANIADPRWAADGDLGFPVWETEIGNIAGLICMDACYFEPARIAALQGADVIVLAANWLDVKAPSPMWMSMAFENGVYVVAADRWGSERGFQFSGGSSILDPNGTIQARLDTGDGIVYGTVDVARARHKSFAKGLPDNKLADRRPTEYSRLTLNTYLWDPLQFHALYQRHPLPTGRNATIGVAQLHPRWGEVELNLGRMASMLDEFPEDVELVVFPELAPWGILSDRQQARAAAQNLLETPATCCILDLARRSGKYLVTSLVELEDEQLFHTAVLVGPEGICGKYRKVHLSSHERAWATPGDLGFPVFDLDFARVGLLISEDILYPEASLCLAAWGCDLICVPSALKFPRAVALGATDVPLPDPVPKGDDPTHFLLWRVRGEQCSTYIAFSAYCGAGYAGRSGIFRPEMETFPRNEILLSQDREQLGSISIDFAASGAAVRAKPAVRMRQPHLYKQLLMREPVALRVRGP